MIVKKLLDLVKNVIILMHILSLVIDYVESLKIEAAARLGLEMW